LLHESYCLYSQRDKFKPYEKSHATVKDACENADNLNVKNLILYHTEDKNILDRKQLYTNEGSEYFKGNIIVPDDLDVINL
jgi:ribonuclease Z